jgi:uncharacterized damage-inducible protein DinB
MKRRYQVTIALEIEVSELEGAATAIGNGWASTAEISISTQFPLAGGCSIWSWMTSDPALSEVPSEFVARARHYLNDSYAPRIRIALDRLSDEDLWWRPNEASNSAGNLVLHLCGNARQWICSGVGGAEDLRERQAEFDERGPISRAGLLAVLDDTFRDIDHTLAAVDPATLLEHRTIQGTDVTLLEAILHVVEHVSHHTGQILWIAKARTGADLGLWAVKDGIAKPTWESG